VNGAANGLLRLLAQAGSAGPRLEIGADSLPTFQLNLQTGGGRPRLSGRARVAEVAGVVKNLRDGVDMTAGELAPIIYLPLRPEDYGQPTLYGVTLIVRTTPGTDAGALVRGELAKIDDKLRPFRARSMLEQIEDILFAVRAATWTYGCIGIFGLVLASVGLAA